MLGSGRGGLEQVALDYHQALASQGYRVLSVLAPDSWAISQANRLGLSVHSLKNLGEWDLLASFRIKRLIQASKAGAVICHGNRAIRLAVRLSSDTPIIAVAHNYKNKSFRKCDAVFCITSDLLNRMNEIGIAKERVCHVPNMVPSSFIAKHAPKKKRGRIGALGRFVHQKGFDILLDAASIVRKSYEYTLLIGGSGPMEELLKKQCHDLGFNQVHNHILFFTCYYTFAHRRIKPLVRN